MKDAYYFLNKDFWASPMLVGLFVMTIFAVVLLRYVSLAWIYQAVVSRLVGTPPAAGPAFRRQIGRELRWSALSSLIFAVLGAGSYWLWQYGHTRVYSDINEYPLAYFFASIVIVLASYETYYYWLHRWMHKPGIFRHVHKVHHDSVTTSVFTSFSFHPLEAVLQFIFLPVVVLVIPVHYAALFVVLGVMTLSAIINHAGVEIFPARFWKHPVGKWLIGSTHHELHHREFRRNFGLYLTCWDKWMGTESPRYGEAFEKNKE